MPIIGKMASTDYRPIIGASLVCITRSRVCLAIFCQWKNWQLPRQLCWATKLCDFVVCL